MKSRRRNPNAKPNMRPFTLRDFERMFPDDAACLEWLFRRFYPEGKVFCDNCQRETLHHRVKSRPSYSCDYCGHHVHPAANTIFHKSPTPLKYWFYAIYLMAQTRCGISAKQIQRETGVTYKCAWRMFKQIRSMLDEGTNPLGGKGGKGVEIDETYVGGRRKYGVGRPPGGGGKSAVVGMVERQGRIKALVSDDVKGSTLLGMVKEHILPDSTVFTDEYVAYDGIGHMRNGYTHRRIKHAAGVYVLGDGTHTNTVEGFWSLLKRGLTGVYHCVGKGYLQSYLNEFSFRYNRRFDYEPMFTSFLNQISRHGLVIRQTPLVCEPF